MKNTNKVPPMATLTVVATFDEFPDIAEIESILESIRCLGKVDVATLKILKEVTKDLR